MPRNADNICAFCGEAISAQSDSREHLIPEAIGGRRRVRGFLHKVCNNEAGRTWDAELARQLRPLSLHFGVKRQKGRTPSLAITTTAGEELILGPKGQLAMAKPKITRTTTAEGFNYQITVGSFAGAREVLEGLKRSHPGIDIDGTMANLQMTTTYPQGAVHFQLDFGNELAGRSLVKSTLALAHQANIPIDSCGDALSYLRQSDGTPCFGYYYVRDLITERPAETPLHCIAIEASPETGLILGYAEYFGIHRAVVCLGRGFAGEPARAVYAIDPRTGTTLDLTIHLAFSADEVEAIYEYKMIPEGAMQEAFGNVFAPALKAQHEAERDRVVREAAKYAFANCGAKEGDMLTEEHMKILSFLFAQRVTPMLLHASGARDQAARRRAAALADHIVRFA
jgi:hypothetical protein